MIERFSPLPEGGNEFGIDLRELKQFVYSRLWLVLAIILVVEALMGMACALATKGFRAEMLIRMGRSVGADAGSQGGVVKKVRVEMAQLPVTLEPRPNGTVMVTAEGDSSGEATALVLRVSSVLMDYDGKALESVVALQKERIKFVEDSIAQVDAEIREQMALMSTGRENRDVVERLGASMNVKDLFEFRHELRNKLIKENAAFFDNFSPAKVIVEPADQAKIFRPNWQRNLSLGATFGLVFGLFVVGLQGVFRQLVARARQ